MVKGCPASLFVEKVVKMMRCLNDILDEEITLSTVMMKI